MLFAYDGVAFPALLLVLVVLLLWECSSLLQISKVVWRVFFAGVGGVLFLTVTAMTRETFFTVFGQLIVFHLYSLLFVWFGAWIAIHNSMSEWRATRENRATTTDALEISVKFSSASNTAKILLSIGCLLVLVALCCSFFGLHAHIGPEVLLCVLGIAWGTDTGAYFIGRNFGKTPLSKRVSPKKTVEGTIGGLLLGLILALILGFGWIQPELGWPTEFVVLVAIALPFFAIFGDLLESVLKRVCETKDSGSILPGHGGLLDRIDSLVLAAPCVLVVALFVINSSS